MKKYPFILFDLDGTLTYSHPGIYESLRYALASLGRPDPDESRLRMCVGPPLVYSFSEVFGLSADEVPVAVRKYRERYADVGWRENAAHSGRYEALKTLKGPGLPPGAGHIQAGDLRPPHFGRLRFYPVF